MTVVMPNRKRLLHSSNEKPGMTSAQHSWKGCKSEHSEIIVDLLSLIHGVLLVLKIVLYSSSTFIHYTSPPLFFVSRERARAPCASAALIVYIIDEYSKVFDSY